MRKYRALRAASVLVDANCTPDLRAKVESLFYDQPHMIREIRQFAGRTPGALDGDDAESLECGCPRTITAISRPFRVDFCARNAHFRNRNEIVRLGFGYAPFEHGGLCGGGDGCGGAPLRRLAHVRHGAASETGIALPTVQKLVSILSKGGLLRSVRGAGGGIQRARPAAAITLADIIEAVEGPIAMTSCINAATCNCAIEPDCHVKPHWAIVNNAVRGACPTSRSAVWRRGGEYGRLLVHAEVAENAEEVYSATSAPSA